MPDTNKPSTGYHQGEEHSRILLLRSRTRLNFTAAPLITDTELPTNHHQVGQCPKESRRLFLLSILTQALALSADVTDDVDEELDS
jgi:hypothetical protein